MPPCNRNASTAGEVYFLGDIINEEELNSLSETAEKIIQNRKNLSEEYVFLFYSLIIYLFILDIFQFNKLFVQILIYISINFNYKFIIFKWLYT